MEPTPQKTPGIAKALRWSVGLLIVVGGVAALATALPNRSTPSIALRMTKATSCQQTPATVSYSELPQASKASGVAVTLNNLDSSWAACRGKAVRVALLDSRDANRPVIDTGTIPATGTTMTLAFPGVPSADVVGVNVAISS